MQSSQVRVLEAQSGVVKCLDRDCPGDDELDPGADNLRNLEAEQSGGIGHKRMIEWMLRNDLTQERAADAIGISRRMLNYYVSAEKPIPKTV